MFGYPNETLSIVFDITYKRIIPILCAFPLFVFDKTAKQFYFWERKQHRPYSNRRVLARFLHEDHAYGALCLRNREEKNNCFAV